MDKVYAQVKDGVIQNRIVLNDASLVSLFTQGFDYLIRVDLLPIQPNIGDSYNGSVFTPAPPIVENVSNGQSEAQIQARIEYGV